MKQVIKNRIIYISLSLLSIILGVSTILYYLSNNISYYYSITKLVEVSPQKSIRIGGIVEKSSVKNSGSEWSFVISDKTHRLNVRYNGAITRIFREGQEVLLKGRLDGEVFIADELLTKHDEFYKPKR